MYYSKTLLVVIAFATLSCGYFALRLDKDPEHCYSNNKSEVRLQETFDMIKRVITRKRVETVID